MLLRIIVSLSLVSSLLSHSATQAQDDPAVKTKAKPAAEAKPGTGDGTEFDKLFEQWKETIKELRTLKGKYVSAKDQETEELEKQWKELIDRGNKLLPQLREAGLASYKESATVDPQLQRFLLKLAQDALQSDDFEVAYDVGKTMLDRSESDKAPAPKELYAVLGVAAFMTNDFEGAEKYIEQAKQTGVWGDYETKFGVPISVSLKKYKEWWPKEEEVRKAEENAEEKDQLPRVRLKTSVGDIVLELFENEAPDTVGNFVSLVEAKFYDGLKFHRVLEHFMAQGGCPKGDGTGDPGYKIYCETDNPKRRRHFRGTLSMAKGSFKDTGGSQFFICFTPRENLDGLHTAFGRVVEGIDVLAKIQRVDPEKPSSVERTTIEKAEVVRKRDHAYLPRKVE